MAITDYVNPYIDQSGNALSPEAIAARRRYAYSMMQQAGDGSPTKANAIGALARALQGTMAGYMAGQTDKDEAQGLSAQGEMWAKAAEGLSGGSPSGPAPGTPSPPVQGVTSAPPSSPGTPGQSGQMSPQVSNRFGNWQQGPTPGTSMPAPAQAAQPMAAPTAGKIYDANEPSPLDPPSGNSRDLLIRTVYGEDPGQSALGVANVIRNRTVNGGFGGDTIPGVVLAKNQFEPWNNNLARSRMAALQPGSPEYNRIGGIVDSAYTGANDPTNGATSFYSPTAQAALGRSTPQWAQGQGQDIGEHRFYGGAPGQQTQLAGPPPTPDSAPTPQGVPPQGAQPQQGPQQQQMIQGLISTVRDPGASVYQKRAAIQILQGVVQKQMGAEMQYMQQPDGSVAWFNKLNPNQHGVITDPGMIERVGAIKKAEAQKAEEGKQAAVGPGLTNLNAEVTGDIPSKVQSALKMVDSEGTVPVTGMGGALLAMKPGTGAYNLQQTLNQIKSSLASAYINHVKAISPDGRGASTEQVEQYLKSQGLEITDKAALRSALLRMQGQFSAPGSNAPPVNLTPRNGPIGTANAGEGTTSGGFRIMKVTPPNGG